MISPPPGAELVTVWPRPMNLGACTWPGLRSIAAMLAPSARNYKDWKFHSGEGQRQAPETVGGCHGSALCGQGTGIYSGLRNSARQSRLLPGPG